MKRRELLQKSAALGFFAAMPISLYGKAGEAEAAHALSAEGTDKVTAVANPLKAPAEGNIPVAFLISDGAVLIDFVGPWEVFQNVNLPGSMGGAFHLYTVGETTNAVNAGGMKVVPDYTLENAPAPKVIVIPAQSGQSEAMMEWIRKSTKNTDVTMSVCTGAFVLAQTGLLAGKAATTHHASYIDLAMKYPDIHVKRGARFVEDGNLASAGGLSSGIDLAFRVVERYYGREVAKQAAYDMEYQGQGWMSADSNAAYLKVATSKNGHPLCAICGMDVDTTNGPKSAYKGKTYYFCSQSHKDTFDKAPETVLAMIGN
jgi:YHS domain-containing protein